MGTDYLPSSDTVHSDFANLIKASTSDSIAIPRDLLEKLYLSPPQTVKGGLRGTFGNPTALPVAALALSTFCLSADLMGWRGAGGDGAATIPVFIFIGGVIQIIGALQEWILGNTFTFEVFGVYGGFFLALGCTLVPSMNAVTSYSPNGSYVEGLASSEFSASFGFFMVLMAVFSFIFTLCAIRTNIVLVVALFIVTIAFGLVAGVYWETALGHMEHAHQLTMASGAFLFLYALSVLYLFFALTLQAVDFPIELPVGDLSWMPSMTSRREAQDRRATEHSA